MNRFICPACGGGTRWPCSIDLDHLEETLEQHLKWDRAQIEKLTLKLEADGLIHRTTRRNNRPCEPWVDVCEPCAVGKQRCLTCHAIVPFYRYDRKDCSRCYRKSLGIPARVPDSQRQKVYRIERKVFSLAFAHNITVEEARDLLKRLSHRFHVPTPVLGNMPRNAYLRAGDYNFSLIRAQGVNRGRVCAGTIVHEFAHHLVVFYYPGAIAHGPEFVRCLYEVMRHAGYAKDRPSQGRWKVKIGCQATFWDAVKHNRLRTR